MLYEGGVLKRLAAGPGIQLMATLEELTIEARVANIASTGAALLVDSQNGDKFLKRLFGGGNLTMSEQAGSVAFAVSIEEVLPGFGNHHVVNGTPLRATRWMPARTSRSARASTSRATSRTC